MVLHYLSIISSYILNPISTLNESKVKGKLLILVAKFFIFCLLSIIFIGDNGWFINIDERNSPLNIHLTKTSPIQVEDHHSSAPMDNELWQYLRKGLNYLEASGKNYPPNFVHPGGKAYGSLGLTRIAVIDVIQNCASLSKFTLKDVFTQSGIYEEFAKNYADLLLRYYLGMDYRRMPPEEVFDVLQRAWFLGPSLYKKEGKILYSREKKAQEYVSKIAASFHLLSTQQEEIF